VVYHFWFYFLRNHHSKNVSKYIDYVYLGVAAIGLLATGLEFSRQQYERDVSETFDAALADLGRLPTALDDRVSFCEIDKKLPPKICNDMREIRTNFSFRLNEVKLRPNVEGVEGLTRWAEALQREYVKLDNPQDSFLTPNVLGIRTRIESLTKGSILFERGGWLYRFRFFGFFLIATAIALRITKVSIEIFEWHKTPV
jgi:hypothetical protein